MTNVHPIRRPDAVDTAKQFAAELDTPGRRPAPRWTAKCFGRSRFRRAAIYDGLAVTLLMALMACLGVVLFAASAKADGVIDGHRLIGVMCGCTTPFVTPDAHAQHVARLVLDAIDQT